MILNEDFFKDLSDDIVDSENDFPDNSHINPEQLFNQMTSTYSHCLSVKIEKHDIIRDDEIWDVQVPHLVKKLQYIFNTYGVEYSEPVLQVQTITYLDYKDCTAIDIHGYTLISKYKTIEEVISIDEITPRRSILLVIYFNLPNVRTFIAGCKFVSNIMKCMWNNSSHEYFTAFFIQFTAFFKKRADYKAICTVNVYNPILYPGLRISMSQMFNIMTLFFPDKDKESIDTDLYNKLKEMFKLKNE